MQRVNILGDAFRDCEQVGFVIVLACQGSVGYTHLILGPNSIGFADWWTADKQPS